MEVQETTDSLIIPVRVKPSSGRFALIRSEQGLLLELTSPPRGGKANQEILSELPRLLRCEVRILRGSSSKKKLLQLKGLTIDDLNLVLDTR